MTGSMWLGPVGQMVRFRAPSVQEVTSESRSSFMTTLGGVVKEQRGPRGRRAWSVRLPGSTRPEEVAALRALVDGALGSPPWAWVDPWAAVTNLLTPAESLLEAGTWTSDAPRLGSVTTDDGVFLPVTLGSGTPVVWPSPGVPVVPGEWVTGSVWVQGSASVILRVRSTSDASAGTFTATVPAGTGLRRVSVSGVVSAAGARAHLYVTGATRIGGAQITLTRAAVPFAHGEGCQKVTVDGLSRSVVMATPGRRYHDVSFTVRELG